MKYEGLKVGQIIRNLRKEHSLTIEELSEIVGINVIHITQIELGNRKMSIDLFCQLIDALETDANTILAISAADNKDYSVDDSLRQLPREKRKYLTDVFKYMIEKEVA